MCRLVALPQSTYYRKRKGWGRFDEESDLLLVEALIKLAGKHPTWGYRYLTNEIRKKKRWTTVNAKRIRRLMKIAGIARKKRRWHLLTTDSRHRFRRYPNLVRDWSVVVRPDQAWAADITYIVLATGEVVYLAIVMDIFTRVPGLAGRDPRLGVRVGLDASSCDERAQTRIQTRPVRDPSFRPRHPICDACLHTASCRSWLPNQHERQRRGMANPRWTGAYGYVERWMRTLKEEEVYLTEYASYQDALRNIGKFIDTVYNKKRSHSALGYLTPKQFEAQWRAEHTPNSPP